MLWTSLKYFMVAACLMLSFGFAAGQARIDKRGRPLLLKDDGGFNWRIPTLVYSDAVEEVYVPDMTAPDWVQHEWNEVGATNGTFTIAMYTYLPSTHGLKEEIVEIDLRRNIATVYEINSKMTLEISLIDHPPLFARIINAKIRPLVTKEIRAFNSALLGLNPDPIDSVGTFSKANSLSGPDNADSGLAPAPVERRPPTMASPSAITTGVYHMGGSVKPPSVLRSVDPEFSEEARKAKFSGNVQVYLWVDEQGNPSNVRVVHGVGMGLDEKAVEAVRQYKFKPAMKDGKPIKVDLYIDINFQIDDDIPK